MLIFLLGVVLLLVSFPFFHHKFSNYLIIFECLFSALLVAGIYTVSSNEKLLVFSVLFAILISVLVVFNYSLQSTEIVFATLFLNIGFYILTTVTIINHVLDYQRVTSDKIYGAISAYILIGVIWALVFTTLELLHPHSFRFDNGFFHSNIGISSHRFYFSEFLYFSFVTLTTLGYGDISPVSNLARAISSLEAIAGQLFVAVLIARLVGLHISHTHWEKLRDIHNETMKNKKD